MKTLHKSSEHKILAGVCGGIADFFDISPLPLRAGFLALSLVFGLGALAYLFAALVIPAESEYSVA